MTDPIRIPHQPLASYPLRPGNDVRPLIDGEPAFRRICEAVERAESSVWVAVAWFRQTFRLPDGRGTFFDLLDAASRRGLDVRVIFWRPNPEATYAAHHVFSGTATDRRMLADRGSRFHARWDRAFGPYCQHQKCWIIDAGREFEIAFVGGINLNPLAMVSPGHVGGGGIHDAYLEIHGPSATDVHHNFVQRWNEASERAYEDGVWGDHGDDDLAFPERLSTARGTAPVQIQRQLHAGLYADARPAPGAPPYPVSAGESTIRDQYLAAIDAARRSIYIENQALSVEPIVGGLQRALDRGVDVVVLLPAEPESWVRTSRTDPQYAAFFQKLASLGSHDNFCLAGLTTDGRRKPVYVHAKLMLVDDEWATIGSCNLHHNSLYGHSELNASIWSAEFARGLRCSLFQEHLDTDTSGLDDREAFSLYRRIARDNGHRRAAGRHDWQGFAFNLDPARYGAPDEGGAAGY